MQIGRFSLKKYLLILAVGIVFYFSFDFLSDFMYKQKLGDHSEAVLAAIHGAKSSLRILRRTGEIYSEEYSLNSLTSSEDSVVLRIKLGGEKATAAIEAHAVRQMSGVWKIYKSDTVFTK
ncbi:hypothetical protein [Hymenobacter armeniacus]|uniref:DUF4878 domain-containing protein n=1 Tax=Hymenobacter armeniacus TaxID=2771358 RepID=A0ABR8JU60_9BACT|nr:hypothetical protein [Hymenobacter armeniacus]MBD2723516.1 hypothetical protein [Hymenobacter armeniacus]